MDLLKRIIIKTIIVKSKLEKVTKIVISLVQIKVICIIIYGKAQFRVFPPYQIIPQI